MTPAQRRRLNAMCGDLERQILLTTRGQYQHRSVAHPQEGAHRLDKNSWRWMFTGTIKGWKPVPAIEGDGFILLGASSTTLSDREAGDVIDLMFAFGNARKVLWSDPEEAAMRAAHVPTESEQDTQR